MTATKKTESLTTITETSYPVVASDQAVEIIGGYLDSGVSPQDLPQLRLPRGGSTMWELAGEEPKKELEVIILYAQIALKKFWILDADDSDEKTPPDCQSTDGIDGYGVRQEGDQQGANSCTTCVRNVRGPSDPSVPRCSNYGRLYVVRPSTGGIECLQIPATSLKPLKAYLGLHILTLGSGTTLLRVERAVRGSNEWSKLADADGLVQGQPLEPAMVERVMGLAKKVKEYVAKNRLDVHGAGSVA